MTGWISEDRVTRWTENLRRIFTRLKRFSARRRVRIAVLVVVLPLFAVALVLAWTRAGIQLSDLAVGPILVVVLAVPLTVLTATWQLRAMAVCGGESAGWWPALRIVTLGALSSLLPISSGTLVRGGAVVYWGVSPGTAALTVVFDAMLWISLSLLYSGVAALVLSVPVFGLALVAGGLLLLPAVIVLANRLPGRGGKVDLASARIAGIVIDVVRLVGCFLALGYSIDFTQGSTLAAAGPLASVVFFLPGGLGIREAFTSAMAVAIGLSAAAAFLAAVLNRLIGLSVLLVWEAGLFVWSRWTPEPRSE